MSQFLPDNWSPLAAAGKGAGLVGGGSRSDSEAFQERADSCEYKWAGG